MRHYKRGRKLGTDASHTKAIKKSLVVNLFTNDRIKTTLERAKEIRGDVDRVVTWAKRQDLHSRRLAIAALGDKNLVAEIFDKVEQGLFEGREGGYTRIYKLGKRRGDDATMVIIELVQEPVVKKVKQDKDEEVETSSLRQRLFGRRVAPPADSGESETDVDAVTDDEPEDDELEDGEEADFDTEVEDDEVEEDEADEAVEEADEVVEDEPVEAADEAAEAADEAAETGETEADEAGEAAETAETD